MKSKILKGSLLFVAGLLYQAQANAQMYVSPNSYVYVNNEHVFVTGNVELNAATSNMYLRNGSQLLQGTAGASANLGLGNLSAFQEGTSNAFDYNYWCSPVGGALAAVGNSPFGITQLGVPTSSSATNTAAILPIGSYNGVSAAGAVSIAPYWIWKFLSSTAYSQWVQAASTSTINAGEGFTMKGTGGTDAAYTEGGVTNNPGSAQRYDFRGKPNDGNITINVAANAFTLTGNPYPSAMDVSRFLLEPGNSNTTRIAYYWDQQRGTGSHYLTSYTGAYATYAPTAIGTTGVYVPATYVKYDGAGNIIPGAMGVGANVIRLMAPIGQGFMVKGALTGTATIMNTHRAWYKEGQANTIFAKGEQNKDMSLKEAQSPNFDYSTLDLTPIPQIRLGVILEGTYQRTLALSLLDRATDGVDPGMDAQSPAAADLPSDAYFFLNNDKYVIQSVAFDENKRLPLGIKVTTTKKFIFHVDEVLNFDESQKIYVYDRVTDTYNDVKSSNFEVMLDPGTYNNRFELTFKDAALGVDDVASGSFVVYQNNGTKSVTISNPLNIELASCGLYDVTGKLIFSKKELGANTSYEFSTANLSEGVYIVKLITKDNTEIGKKIIVKN
jgi:hypothetical protein